MWEEFLEAGHVREGQGIDGRQSARGQRASLSASPAWSSVLNPGLDRNWCGHHFSQSNWYASGRLAWNPELSAQQIADEWTRMTFTNDAKTVETIRDMMMGSRETFVNYTMPLGPASPDRRQPLRADAARTPRRRAPTGRPTYYHQASADGIGFDRTMKRRQGRRPIFPAGVRHVRQPRDVSGKIPAVVPSLPVGLQDEVRQDAVGRACARSTRKARGRPRQCRRPGNRSPARSIRSATRKSPIAWRFKSPTRRSGADQILRYFQTFSKTADRQC